MFTGCLFIDYIIIQNIHNFKPNPLYSDVVYHTYWDSYFVLSGITGRLKAVLILANSAYPCADAKFCQRGSKFDNFFFFFFFFFLVDEGIEDPNVTINGPLSACQRNAI